MELRITARRATVGESFQRLIEERVAKLERYEPRIHGVFVLVEEDGARVALEARAEVPGSPPLIARGEADSRRTALDQALQKLRRQLRRRRTMRVDHKAPPITALSEE